MANRPKTLIYANAERPPVFALWVLGLQHAALAVVFLLYAVMIGKASGLAVEQQQTLVTATLLGCGIGALLQSGHWRFASGLLIIPIAGPIYLPLAIQAGISGGLGTIAAVAVTVGIVQVVIGRFIHVVRAYFPPEVCGVVVLMLGVSLIPGALQRMVGGGPGIDLVGFDDKATLVSGVTLVAIVLASVWLKGAARFFAMLFGCLAGLATAFQVGYLDTLGDAIAVVPLVSLPQLAWPSFQLIPTLLPIIVLLALIDSVDCMGVLISTERLDDAEWIRPNQAHVSRGIQGAGLTNMVTGCLGGTATGLSSSNIGLAFATGVTSRSVGIAAGVLLITATLFPQLIALVLAMPDPVLGGILAYVASYFVVVGADLALSRMLSQRRMLVIGLSITTGLAPLAMPQLFHGLSGPLAPIFESPLTLSAIAAISLNALMRLGIAQTQTTTMPTDQPYGAAVRETLDELGERWGLHRATVSQASNALHELMEVVATLTSGPITLEARTDDLHLDLRLLYAGEPMVLSERRPTAEEMLDDPTAVARMSGWLLRRLAGRATTFDREGQQGVWLRFES